MRKSALIALCVALSFAGTVSADQPTDDLFRVADAARIAWENSSQVAADSVGDDGFLSDAELAQKKAEAYKAGDPDLKAAWDNDRGDIEGGSWTVEPTSVKLTLGAWDRNQKQWTVTATSQYKGLPTTLQLVWNIKDRAGAKAIYDQVNAQGKAKTIGARINYSVSWLGGSLWQRAVTGLDIVGEDGDGSELVIGSLSVDPSDHFWSFAATSSQKANQICDLPIGWLGPETGDSALWGLAELATVNMIAEDINKSAEGGVRVGDRIYKLRIVAYDDAGDSAEAVSGAKRLTHQDKVVAVIGPQGSGEAIPIAPIMNDAKVPCVASTATNPRVTVTQSGSVNPYMFRACFTDPYQGKVAGYFAYEKLAKRNAAIFMTIDDPYSTGLAQHFKENFEKLGGNVVAEGSYTSGDEDFRAQLTKIRAANPDVLFIPAYYNDVALAAKQARDLGINQLLLGGDGWPSDNLIQLAGDALEGCLFINHLDYDSPDAKPMRDEYKAKYNKNAELNSYVIHDALMMVIDAIQRAKSVEGPDIQKALESCDIQGITGHIKIGPKHDPVGKTAWIIRLVGPDMKFQETFSVAD